MAKGITFIEKKEGYLSASDLIDRDPLTLTIASVDPGVKHTALDDPNLVINFHEIDDSFHVNFKTEDEFRSVWGRKWSGNQVRIDVIRTFMRGYMVYGLRARPIVPCDNCGEYTAGRTPKGKALCDWCRLL